MKQKKQPQQERHEQELQ